MSWKVGPGCRPGPQLYSPRSARGRTTRTRETPRGTWGIRSRIGESITRGLSQFSFDENGTVPFHAATVILSPILRSRPAAGTYWPGPTRRAFTLLEVILASGLLLGCVIVLAELASLGRQNANAAEDLTTAELLCQNRLNEILVGAVPLELVDSQPLEEDDWQYSVALEPIAQPGLVALRVTVARQASSSRAAREFSLVRWIPDPGLSADNMQNSPGMNPPGGTAPGGTP